VYEGVGVKVCVSEGARKFGKRDMEIRNDLLVMPVKYLFFISGIIICSLYYVLWY